MEAEQESTWKGEDEFTTNEDDNDKQESSNTVPCPNPTQPQPKPIPSILKSQFVDDLEVSIVGYDRDLSFFSDQTQIYNIQLLSLHRKEVWVVNKRYSDIKWLHQVLTTNHVGYILPFLPSAQQISEHIISQMPSKNRQRIIEYKIDLITQFLTAIYSHEKLRSSQEAKTLILKSQEEFKREKKRVDRIAEEGVYLETEGSTFVGLLENASYFLWNFIGGQEKEERLLSREDVQFELEGKRVQEDLERFKKLKHHLELLANLKMQQGETQSLKGDWNRVQILNTTIQASRKFNLQLSQDIQQSTLMRVNLLILEIQEVGSKIDHRRRLVKFIASLKQNIEDQERVEKLESRISQLESNFRESFDAYKSHLVKEKERVSKEFGEMWKRYKKQMRMVWL